MYLFHVTIVLCLCRFFGNGTTPPVIFVAFDSFFTVVDPTTCLLENTVDPRRTPLQAQPQTTLQTNIAFLTSHNRMWSQKCQLREA